MKVTFPGFCADEVAGDPPGKIHEYLAAAMVVPKETEVPAAMVVSEAGEVIAPTGAEVA